MKGVRIGAGTQVSLLCRIFGARSIEIGAGTEILRNCTLDGGIGMTTAVRIGQDCRIKENVWLATYGGRINLGDRVLLGRNCVVHGHGGITIGNDSMLGPGCLLFSSDHSFDTGQVFQRLGERRASTHVGSNVWLGAGVIVTAGLGIADNVVVGAGSVVTRSLESGFVYVGAPARPLRRISNGDRGGSDKPTL